MTSSEHPGPVPPPAEGPQPAANYALPDLSDLVGNGKQKAPSDRKLPPRTLFGGAAAVLAVVLAVGGFFVGRATASTGPSTLAEAVQQASAGKLPCGTSNGAGGGFLTAICNGGANGTGFGGGFGGGRFGGNGAGGGAGQNGTGQNGAGRGGLAGGLFGPGSVTGTITSVSGTSIQVQTRAGTITVNLPSSVQITTNATGSTKDLATGRAVVITASTDASGARTAQKVYILPQTN